MPGGEQVLRHWGWGWFSGWGHVCDQHEDRTKDTGMTFSNNVGMSKERRGSGNMGEKQ